MSDKRDLLVRDFVLLLRAGQTTFKSRGELLNIAYAIQSIQQENLYLKQQLKDLLARGKG